MTASEFDYGKLAFAVLEKLSDHPTLISLTIPASILAYRCLTPEAIKAFGEVFREGRKSKVEVEHRRKILADKLEKRLTRRTRNIS